MFVQDIACSKDLSKANIPQRVEKLFNQRTLESLQEALPIYEEFIKENPDNYLALTKAAKTCILILDIKTKTLIDEKYKDEKLLKRLGEKGYNYAQKAHQIKPDGKEAIAYILQSYGYYSASFGLVKIAFSGIPGRLKKLSHKLNKIDPYFDGCTGYQTLGRMYWEVPWPVGNDKKAEKNFKKVLGLNSELLQPRYWMAMIELKKDNKKEARRYLKYIIENPATELEKHFIDAYREKASNLLKDIKINKKQ